MVPKFANEKNARRIAADLCRTYLKWMPAGEPTRESGLPGFRFFSADRDGPPVSTYDLLKAFGTLQAGISYRFRRATRRKAPGRDGPCSDLWGCKYEAYARYSGLSRACVSAGHGSRLSGMILAITRMVRMRRCDPLSERKSSLLLSEPPCVVGKVSLDKKSQAADPAHEGRGSRRMLSGSCTADVNAEC
jgi:hypothetical protein